MWLVRRERLRLLLVLLWVLRLRVLVRRLLGGQRLLMVLLRRKWLLLVRLRMLRLRLRV